MSSPVIPTGPADGPRWRLVSDPLLVAALFWLWCIVAVVVGLALQAAVVWAVWGRQFDGTALLAVWAPGTVAMVAWVLGGAAPARLDSEQDWSSYATRRLIIGGGGRPRALAVLVALLLGGPVATSWALWILLEIASIFA